MTLTFTSSTDLKMETRPHAKANPAISRLSASSASGNDPRHPNVARGVRETCIGMRERQEHEKAEVLRRPVDKALPPDMTRHR
jgi:hypothetical protein